MAKFHSFKTFGPETISAGAKWENNWTADEDYIIKRIYIVDQEGKDLYNIVCTFQIEQFVFTKDKIPAALLGATKLTSLELDLDLKKDHVFKWAITNNDSVSRTLYLILELWKE
ncbi:hypothetical protein J7K74_03765 [Candidatus Woesearchaeota archaeon]|nr:hypothetical protein [Candidatus Woesearchaeota archaeon]